MCEVRFDVMVNFENFWRPICCPSEDGRACMARCTQHGGWLKLALRRPTRRHEMNAALVRVRAHGWPPRVVKGPSSPRSISAASAWGVSRRVASRRPRTYGRGPRASVLPVSDHQGDPALQRLPPGTGTHVPVPVSSRDARAGRGRGRGRGRARPEDGRSRLPRTRRGGCCPLLVRLVGDRDRARQGGRGPLSPNLVHEQERWPRLRPCFFRFFLF
jgi:hypothetical protein